MVIHCTNTRTRALLALATALLVAAPARAVDKTEYSHGEFEQVLAEAMRITKARNTREVIRGIDPHEGGWVATIHGEWPTGNNTTQWMTLPALIANHFDRCEYTFYGPGVPLHLIQGVRNHKGMLKAEKYSLKEYQDLNLTVGVDSNRVTLTASYSYAQGVSEKDIAERMKWLFQCSTGIMVWTGIALAEVQDAFTKEINGRKLTQLSKEELELLVDDGLDKWVSKNHQAAEGAWFFNYKDRPMYIFNHGKTIDFAHYYTIPESVQGENRQKVLQAVQEYVSKKRMAKASRQEVTWYGEGKEEATWAKISFDLDGNIKGEELKKAYFDFYQKYTQDLERAIEKIIKDHS